MTLPFHKYHGLGNDFILLETEGPFDPAHARALCDRHFGIGADGILTLWPAHGFDAQMVVTNADGTRPEICGNGLRCAAFHIASMRLTAPGTIALSLLTDAGVSTCAVAFDPSAPTCQVTVDVGHITTQGASLIRVHNRDLNVHRANVGNPHAVVFEDVSDADFALLGQGLATHPSFPNGANASFVRPIAPNHFAVRVWERGVGPTLACGTAACAVATVARHIAPTHNAVPTTIHLPGGQLTIDVAPSGSTTLTGPATFVFRGHLPPMPHPP
jgi:diaminopimelate epimerase